MMNSDSYLIKYWISQITIASVYFQKLGEAKLYKQCIGRLCIDHSNRNRCKEALRYRESCYSAGYPNTDIGDTCNDINPTTTGFTPTIRFVTPSGSRSDSSSQHLNTQDIHESSSTSAVTPPSSTQTYFTSTLTMSVPVTSTEENLTTTHLTSFTTSYERFSSSTVTDSNDLDDSPATVNVEKSTSPQDIVTVQPTLTVSQAASPSTGLY